MALELNHQQVNTGERKVNYIYAVQQSTKSIIYDNSNP